ncbi:MAG: S41 family peptidase [Thermoguttaceae bacterium]
MRRWVPSIDFRVFLILAAFAIALPAFGQTTAKFLTSDANGDVAGFLQSGRQFEQQHRWGEALAHYEDAIRHYPNDAQLQQRFDSARLHYDLERRYADRSFRRSVSQLSTERALELYGQVLLKIETHYVEIPHWKTLLDHGAGNLEMALGEPMFVNQNVAPDDRPAIDAFCREMRSLIAMRTIASRDDARETVAAVARLAEQRLHVAASAVVLEYLCGATSALDPYSTYLTPDQLNEVYAQIEGNFVGLGVELKAQQNALVIVRVISGSPAEQSGVLPQDRILAIDGQSTDHLSTDQAANLLQGLEGTAVSLALAAPGQPSRQLEVQRRRVEVPSVDQVSIVDRQYGIGYFKLTCFQKTTARDLDAALWKLHRDGMKSLVIDVRGNPGGLLLSAVEAADRFIERGIIVSTRGRSVQEDFTYSAHVQGKWQMPLVVLIDQDSASAAEIFAGAIRDHHRGTIVGIKSFGKGSVQGIFPLDDSTAGVRLTTAKFYSPTGRPYSRIGVEPDVLARPTRTAARPIDGQLPAGGDAMLNAALQAARQFGQPLQARTGTY